MECAREGYLVASVRQSPASSEKEQPSTASPDKTSDKDSIITRILQGQAVLSDKVTAASLASHLHTCSAQTGHMELQNTLQVAGLVIQSEKAQVIAGSGLLQWLLSLAEELAHNPQGDLLRSVMDLLTQGNAVLLTSLAGGMESRSM